MSSTWVWGVLAALAAPWTTTVGFIVWDNHWTGSAFGLNLWKCTLASLGFLIVSATTRDDPFSRDVFQRESVGYLMVSSLLGIVIGDLTWLEGLRLLGARRVIVMDSLKPFLAAVFGWLWLGEELSWGALGGIVLTVLGVLLVSLESTTVEEEEDVDVEEDDNDEVRVEEEKIQGKQEDRPISTGETSVSLVTGHFSETSYSSTAPSSPVIVVDEQVVEVSNHAGTGTDHGGVDGPATPPPPPPIQIPIAAPLPEPRPSSHAATTNAGKRATNLRQTQRGFAMALLNVVLDTYGSVLTKQHGAEFTTWEINLVRFGFAAAVMMLGSLTLCFRDYIYRKLPQKHLQGDPIQVNSKNEPIAASGKDAEARDTEEAGTTADGDTVTAPLSILEESPAWYHLPLSTMTRSAWSHVCFGVLLVTFVTPALSNYALFQIALALALTLGSVGPLYALPLTFLMQRHETPPPSLQSWSGAGLAVAGIVVLAYWGTRE